MFNELSYELADVRTAIKALEKRVDTVERMAMGEIHLFEPTEAEPPARPSASLAFLTEPAAKLTEPLKPLFDCPVPDNYSTDPATTESDREGLEVFVGRNLNKLGISFLVIGCALALVYQFQYFTPILKILSGLVGGALLIWGGEKIEKDNFKMAWYGRALLGGGWALSYFSIFAAHHFPTVRIIESSIVDVALLFAVASGSIFHSLKYKSETITGITLTLAFATICLSPATSFTLMACSMLVAVLVGLSLKMKWFNLFVYGESIFYAVYVGFILPQIMRGQNAMFGINSADGNFFTAVACSVFCWMAMNLVIFNSKDLRSSDRNRLVVASLINCAVFVPTVLLLMSGAHESMKFGFLLATGLAYFASTLTADKSIAAGPLTCNRILGLALVTMAVPLKLTGDWSTVFWVLEVPVLVWAGLRYEMPSLRRFATVLGLYAAGFIAWYVLFPPTSTMLSLLTGIIGITAYGVTAALYEENRTKSGLMDRVAFHFHFALCAGIATAILSMKLFHFWLMPGFVLGCALTVFMGFKLSDKTLRGAGLIAMFVVGAPLSLGLFHLSASLGIFLVVPALLYLSYEYRKLEGDDPYFQLLCQSAATAMLTALIARYVHGFTLEVVLAFEIILIAICAFIMRNTSTKVVAFLMSTVLAIKFLLMDSSNSGSIQLLGESLSMVLVYGIVCGGTLITFAGMYLSRRLRSYSGDNWQIGFYAHAVLAAMIVAALTQSQVSTHWLSIAMTVEGVAVLTLGFIYKNKVLRVSGLSVLAVVICRLLFIELASVETIYRILSFIGAGVVLLVASLAYAKMSNETAITKS